MSFNPTGRVALRKLKSGTVWYVIINEKKDEKGNYPQRKINTHLPERGNKKNAEKILEEELEKYRQELSMQRLQSGIAIKEDILFIDYLKSFIKDKQRDLATLVYDAYLYYIEKIEKFFIEQKRKPLLTEIKPYDIYQIRQWLRNSGMKIITIKKYDNIMRPALKKAYIYDLIEHNPYEKVDRLKKDPKEDPKRSYLTNAEIIDFFEKVKETRIGKLYMLSTIFGLRRSELLGIKLSGIDFENKILYIDGTVQKRKKEFLFQDFNKTKESKDYFKMSDEAIEIIESLIEETETNKKETLCYNKDYSEYLCVDELGFLYNPDYLSKQIKQLVKKHSLKDIHLHSLRHSYGSLLYDKTKDLKLTQEMMRHSDIRTTLIYVHTESDKQKEEACKVISNAINFKLQ